MLSKIPGSKILQSKSMKYVELTWYVIHGYSLINSLPQTFQFIQNARIIYNVIKILKFLYLGILQLL